ncbi:hypothetical protein DDZ13_09730 [Coraliomargarita sinensis]|uniref:DUF4279 domain-containing protein n=1 Tax=Coraliomargarita sinensis TaxID=2174842 RepID=A0A317ZF33_9BACT|nr:DUF4279 domain-containing protein [Coraliomargarita sinensis]PXA03910.1 hypothetical protein DDZ13_09730 [Coraliomargarita sinensis]
MLPLKLKRGGCLHLRNVKLNSYTFQVSLRIKHPTLKPDEITRALGLVPSLVQAAGKNRRTPDEKILKDVCRETFWHHKFHISESASDLESSIVEIIASLKSNLEFLNTIKEAGGSAELFCGVFLDVNIGLGFDNSLTQLLAEASLPLSVDLYPPDEQE